MKVAAGSGFGSKPRPALIIQAAAFAGLGTVVVALFTGTLNEMPISRPLFEPTPENGLISTSDLMTDILITVRHERIGGVIGRLNDEDMRRVDRALLIFLDLAG